MALSVTDSFSNRLAHVEEALSILGRSERKWDVFLAIYKGKKKRKSVEEIAQSTGLTRAQVLNAAKPMARGGLFHQEGRDPVEYIKIEEIAHIRDKVVARRRTSSAAKSEAKASATKRSTQARPIRRKPKAQKSGKRKFSFDVFISHASEDKEPFVRSLAEEIREAGISVWYDEFSLDWGDRLRATIDAGLRDSKFGLVVLSPDFFRKDWPLDELEGLFALERDGETKILPIWHNISKADLVDFSPTLVGRLAVSSKVPIQEIIAKLKKRLDN